LSSAVYSTTIGAFPISKSDSQHRRLTTSRLKLHYHVIVMIDTSLTAVTTPSVLISCTPYYSVLKSTTASTAKYYASHSHRSTHISISITGEISSLSILIKNTQTNSATTIKLVIIKTCIHNISNT
jgi:hypothetical protein